MADIPALLQQLGSPHGLERQAARVALVEVGAPAVPGLIEALGSSNEKVRWEAAKALTEIPDARATDALVKALEDRVYGIRWLAANALIGIGPSVLEPLLRALIDRPDSPWLRDGAKHVFHSLSAHDEHFKTQTAPVVEALQSIEPAMSVPWAARDLLRRMGRIPE